MRSATRYERIYYIYDKDEQRRRRPRERPDPGLRDRGDDVVALYAPGRFARPSPGRRERERFPIRHRTPVRYAIKH